MAAIWLYVTQVQKHVSHVVIVNVHQGCMWRRNVDWNLQSFFVGFQ